MISLSAFITLKTANEASNFTYERGFKEFAKPGIFWSFQKLFMNGIINFCQLGQVQILNYMRNIFREIWGLFLI